MRCFLQVQCVLISNYYSPNRFKITILSSSWTQAWASMVGKWWWAQCPHCALTSSSTPPSSSSPVSLSSMVGAGGEGAAGEVPDYAVLIWLRQTLAWRVLCAGIPCVPLPGTGLPLLLVIKHSYLGLALTVRTPDRLSSWWAPFCGHPSQLPPSAHTGPTGLS